MNPVVTIAYVGLLVVLIWFVGIAGIALLEMIRDLRHDRERWKR